MSKHDGQVKDRKAIGALKRRQQARRIIEDKKLDKELGL